MRFNKLFRLLKSRLIANPDIKWSEKTNDFLRGYKAKYELTMNHANSEFCLSLIKEIKEINENGNNTNKKLFLAELISLLSEELESE